MAHPSKGDVPTQAAAEAEPLYKRHWAIMEKFFKQIRDKRAKENP